MLKKIQVNNKEKISGQTRVAMSYSTQNLESVKAVARGFTNKTTNQNPNFNRKMD